MDCHVIVQTVVVDTFGSPPVFPLPQSILFAIYVRIISVPHSGSGFAHFCLMFVVGRLPVCFV
jgi:hypothetical protein